MICDDERRDAAAQHRRREDHRAALALARDRDPVAPGLRRDDDLEQPRVEALHARSAGPAPPRRPPRPGPRPSAGRACRRRTRGRRRCPCGPSGGRTGAARARPDRRRRRSARDRARSRRASTSAPTPRGRARPSSTVLSPRCLPPIFASSSSVAGAGFAAVSRTRPRLLARLDDDRARGRDVARPDVAKLVEAGRQLEPARRRLDLDHVAGLVLDLDDARAGRPPGPGPAAARSGRPCPRPRRRPRPASPRSAGARS